jgi:(S)-ureidoglycine aminohydrolase
MLSNSHGRSRKWTAAVIAVCLTALELSAQNLQLQSGVKRLKRIPAPGHSELLIDAATTDLAHLKVEVVTVAPGAPLHSASPHSDEELIIVKTGTFRATVNGHRRTLGPAGVVVIMPNDAHDLENAGKEPLTCYVFTYRAKLAPDSARARKAGGSFMVDWSDVVLQKTETGGVRRTFDRATSMLDRFEMHASLLNAGLTNHAAHSHRAEEVVVMLRGDVSMLIGDKRETATAGDIYFLGSQLPHSLDNIGKGPAEYFAFQWPLP